MLDSTLNTDLNVTTLVGVLLLHVGPHFSGQMLLQKGVAVLVELGVSDDRNALGERSVHDDSILLELALCHLIGQVLYHENDWLGISGMHQRVQHL